MSIITIDCGASFIKASVFDENSEAPRDIKRYSTERLTESDIIDAEDENLPNILKRTITVVKRCIMELSKEGQEIQLGISNEMHGFVLADGNDRPLMDYVSWQKELSMAPYPDDASKTWHDVLRKELSSDDILKTGMPFKPGLPSANLAYLMKTSDACMNASEIYFYTLGDFICKRLIKKDIYIHSTNAAATGLYDIEQNRWNDKLIEKLHLSKINFPKITQGSESSVADWHERRIIIYPALGDQQAALWGTDFRCENQLSVNLGTGAQVSRLVDHCVLSDQFQTRPFINNKYLLTVPHIPSGRAINVFFRFVKDAVNGIAGMNCEDELLWDGIKKAVSNVDDNCDLEVDMSFFSNAVTAYDKGSINSISEDNFHVGELFFAIYKKMVENVMICTRKIGDEQFVIQEIIYTGGVAEKNESLQEQINSHFPGVTAKVYRNETLYGIKRYIENN